MFLAALGYLGYIAYRQFMVKDGCAKNCGCDSPVHQFRKRAKD